MKKLYETTVINSDGLEGNVVADTGYTFKTAAVKNQSDEFTNPEQLIAAAWATCLNATIQSILNAKNLKLKSKVEVHVTLNFDEITRLQFDLLCSASIESLSIEETEQIIHSADKFCPVSKLISESKTKKLVAVLYK